jgi:hypothetical protein
MTERKELFQFLPVLSTEEATVSSSEGWTFIAGSIGVQNEGTLGCR